MMVGGCRGEDVRGSVVNDLRLMGSLYSSGPGRLMPGVSGPESDPLTMCCMCASQHSQSHFMRSEHHNGMLLQRRHGLHWTASQLPDND